MARSRTARRWRWSAGMVADGWYQKKMGGAGKAGIDFRADFGRSAPIWSNRDRLRSDRLGDPGPRNDSAQFAAGRKIHPLRRGLASPLELHQFSRLNPARLI